MQNTTTPEVKARALEIVASWEKAEVEAEADENRTPEEIKADMQHAALAQAECELAPVEEWNPLNSF